MIRSGAEKQNVRGVGRRNMFRKNFLEMGAVRIADNDKMLFGGKIALGAFCTGAKIDAPAFANATIF